MDNKDLDVLLCRWNDDKEKIKELEGKCEKYKKLADKMMRKNDTDKLKGSNYIVTRREMTKNNYV